VTLTATVNLMDAAIARFNVGKPGAILQGFPITAQNADLFVDDANGLTPVRPARGPPNLLVEEHCRTASVARSVRQQPCSGAIPAERQRASIDASRTFTRRLR
jgi:hypothetical protein